MGDEPFATWGNALGLLARWHVDHGAAVGRAVFGFIESELRLMTPPVVRRTWPADLIEDALFDFLERLLKKPLPDGIEDPRSYLRRAFRHHCIDCYEARGRRRETPLEGRDSEWERHVESSPTSLDTMLIDEQRARVREALGRLSVVDRVVLKLEAAPEWMSEEEIAWLASRTGSSSSSVREAIASAGDMHELSRVFDPGDDAHDDPEQRRLRMERFRRRRARAREKLRILLDEERI